jgi:hypothetical protein
MNDEFYIGWQNNAPTGYAKWTKRVIWVLFAIFILVGALMVMNQRGFIASTYEKNRFRILEGILITGPIPCLKILAGTDAQGVQHFERVLLVGIGKKSAAPMLHALKKQLKQPIAGKALRLKGKLIYFDGVLAFELGGQASLFQGYSKLKITSTLPRLLGKTQLNGEILDPKCYLGVMRPGEGKPHRSCAIRCIAGGIPPFFKSSTKEDYHQYFFVLDKNGRPINREIAPYVADEIQICGQVEKWDNWYILKADLQQGFYRISPFWAKGRSVSMCQ